MEEIASATLANLRRVQPTGPYRLGGYSFGGLLAYEAAQQLVAAGETVSLLAIYDVFTPEGRVEKPRPAWQRIGIHAYLLATRKNRGAYLLDKLRRRRSSPAVVPVEPDAGDLNDVMTKRVTAANTQAAAAYKPLPYPGEVVLFRSSERPSHHMFLKVDETGGWGAVARGGVRVEYMPGNHWNMLSAENAAGAARKLAGLLP
jgi:thioesterase domain-containing protein